VRAENGEKWNGGGFPANRIDLHRDCGWTRKGRCGRPPHGAARERGGPLPPIDVADAPLDERRELDAASGDHIFPKLA
jgi:hypothetical protein